MPLVLSIDCTLVTRIDPSGMVICSPDGALPVDQRIPANGSERAGALDGEYAQYIRGGAVGQTARIA